MYFLPISILYALFGIFGLVIAYQHSKKEETKKSTPNDVAIGLIFIMCAVLYPFMYTVTGLDQVWQNIFNLASSVLLYGFFGFLSFYIFQQYYLGKKDPSRLEERAYGKFVEDSGEFEDSKKRDSLRKLLHVIPVAVVLLVYLASFLIIEILNDLGKAWLGIGITQLGLVYFLVVLIGYSFIAMFMMEDTLRLLSGNKYFYLTPDWAHKWIRSSLSKNETQTFISSIPLVLCFMPFLFFSFDIFVAVALVTSVADAMASIVGKRFGKHKLPMNPDKSIEGSIGGGLATFGSVLATFLLIPGVEFTLVGIFVCTIAVTIVFVLIDMYNKVIVDNILNPLLTGTVMVLLANIPFLLVA